MPTQTPSPKILPSPESLLGLALGAAAVYFASRELSLENVVSVMRQMHLGWALAALAASFVGQYFKVRRWQVMLSGEPDPPDFLTLWVFHMTGQLTNIFTPGPTGDMGRAYILGGRGLGRSFTLGTIALEKFLDLITFSFLVLVVLVIVPLPERIETSAITLLVAAAAGIIILWLGVSYKARLSGWAVSLLDILPGKIGERIRTMLKAALESLNVLRGRSQVRRLARSTLILWMASILVNSLMLSAFDIRLPFIASVLLLIVLQLGVSTNVVPGTIGLFEYLCVQTLAIYDVPQDLALSFGITLHVIVLLPLIAGAIAGALGGFWKR